MSARNSRPITVPSAAKKSINGIQRLQHFVTSTHVLLFFALATRHSISVSARFLAHCRPRETTLPTIVCCGLRVFDPGRWRLPSVDPVALPAPQPMRFPNPICGQATADRQTALICKLNREQRAMSICGKRGANRGLHYVLQFLKLFESVSSHLTFRILPQHFRLLLSWSLVIHFLLS